MVRVWETVTSVQKPPHRTTAVFYVGLETLIPSPLLLYVPKTLECALLYNSLKAVPIPVACKSF